VEQTAGGSLFHKEGPIDAKDILEQWYLTFTREPNPKKNL